MSRVPFLAALLGLVLLGGIAGPTPARATLSAVDPDPNNMCSLLPEDLATIVSPIPSNRPRECALYYGSNTATVNSFVIQKVGSAEAARDLMQVQGYRGSSQYIKITALGLGDEGWEARTFWPDPDFPQRYDLTFRRGQYIFGGSYKVGDKVNVEPMVKDIYAIARRVDQYIEALLVRQALPPQPTQAPPTPTAKATSAPTAPPTATTKPTSTPTAPPVTRAAPTPTSKPQAKPERPLTEEETELALQQAIAGVSPDVMQEWWALAFKRGYRTGGGDPGRAGFEGLLRALGNPKQPTQLQTDASLAMGRINLTANLVDDEGRPWFPSMRALMPSIIKLALRASADPDALTALKRLNILLAGMDVQAALREKQ